MKVTPRYRTSGISVFGLKELSAFGAHAEDIPQLRRQSDGFGRLLSLALCNDFS